MQPYALDSSIDMRERKHPLHVPRRAPMWISQRNLYASHFPRKLWNTMCRRGECAANVRPYRRNLVVVKDAAPKAKVVPILACPLVVSILSIDEEGKVFTVLTIYISRSAIISSSGSKLP